MTDLKDIPDETKWKLAAGCAARLPAMYDIVFRPAVGKRYEELEEEIWVELGNITSEIAHSLRLPLNNAQELAESMRMVMTILFGPDAKGEVIEVGEDGAVIIVKRCPFLFGGSAVGIPYERAFHRCLAFNLSSQKKLNPKYASRYVRAICMGDRQCEIKVGMDAEKKSKQDAEKGA
jgi:hypothetical protein